MGKFVKGLLVGVLAVILCALCAHQLGVCKISFDRSGPGDAELVYSDSIQQDVNPMNILDKTYLCAEDVLMDHQELVIEVRYVDTFRDIPDETLQNVVNILLRTRPCITIKDIVNEYLANQNIYDNIQPNAVIDPGANSDSINKPTTETKPQESTNIQDPNPVAVQEQVKALSPATTNSPNTQPTR